MGNNKIKEIMISGYILENTDNKANKNTYVSEAFDIIIDILKVNKNRPALECKYCAEESGIINGLYYWDAKDKIIGVINGVPYEFTRENDEEYSVESIGDTDILDTTNKVYFAANEKYVIMANGGKMLSWEGTGLASFIADGDAPTTVDVVEYLDNYILALDKTNNKWYFSSATDGLDSPITWSGDYYSFEGKPDNVTSIIVANSVIYGFCTSSIELWYNDASPFSRVSGGILDSGCKHTDTIKELDGIIYYLGSDNHIYMLSNTTFKSISLLIDNTLSSYDFDNANSDIITINGLKFYILNIPSENISYVYSINDGGWLKWSKYDDGTRTEFTGRYFITGPDNNIIGVDSSHIGLFELNVDGEVDDKIETEYAERVYDDVDLLAGIEPWDGVSIQMDTGSHTEDGTCKFRANQDKSVFDTYYNSFGDENLNATRTSTEEYTNLNKKYNVECIVGGTGGEYGVFRMSSFGYSTVDFNVMAYESAPDDSYYPWYYYPNITPDSVFGNDFKMKLKKATTGPINGGAYAIFDRVAGTVTGYNGFDTDNIEEWEFLGTELLTITVTVETQSNMNVFEISRLNNYPIVYQKKTGWITTANRRIIRALKIKLNRDYISYVNPGANFEIRYKDNGKDWSNWISSEIKQDSDGFFAYIRNLGMTYSRQYEIRCLYPIQLSVDKLVEIYSDTHRQLN